MTRQDNTEDGPAPRHKDKRQDNMKDKHGQAMAGRTTGRRDTQQQKPAISTYCSTIKSCDNMVDLWPMEFATSKWFDGMLLTGASISTVPK
jgi:hypothetical protein